MYRRWLWPSCLTVFVTAAGLHGLGAWPTHPSSLPTPGAAGNAESVPQISHAEYRYVQSQPAHWRALMIQQ